MGKGTREAKENEENKNQTGKYSKKVPKPQKEEISQQTFCILKGKNLWRNPIKTILVNSPKLS
jgi:hypothetical protein